MTVPPFDRHAYITSLVRDVPDYPKPGIVFKDITPLLGDPKGFHCIMDALAERFLGEPFDAVVGIEARGFIFGAVLAARLNVAFVPARKPGKLPCAADRVAYDTEYSTTALELHRDALRPGARVICVDDVLATGGTARATRDLIARQGAEVAAFAFAIELGFLGGRSQLGAARVESVLHFG
jgi:adenine phosphoribosyltransferase